MSNPLSYVLTNLRYLAEELPRLLREKASEEEIVDVGQSLSDAIEGAGRVESLIGSLRTYVRGETDRREPVDVSAVVGLAASVTKSEVRRNSQLSVTCDARPTAWGNTVSLTQLLITLILHVSRAMSDEAKNEISLHVTESAGRVEISLRHNGPEGSGESLELAGCRRIVDTLGGVLRVSREDDLTILCVVLAASEQQRRGSMPPRAA